MSAIESLSEQDAGTEADFATAKYRFLLIPPFRLPTDLAETFLAVPLDEAGIFDVDENFGGDPALPPPNEFLNGPAHAVNLTKILLNGSPHYEWPRFGDENTENEEEAREQLLRFLSYLLQLPEYQLT